MLTATVVGMIVVSSVLAYSLYMAEANLASLSGQNTGLRQQMSTVQQQISSLEQKPLQTVTTTETLLATTTATLTSTTTSSVSSVSTATITIAIPPISNGVTIDSSSRASSFRADYQNHFCYAAGLTWVFYSNGTKYLYQTSLNGTYWRNRTPIMSSGSFAGGALALTCDGYGNFVYFDPGLGTTTLYYREGTLQSSGLISWDSKEQNLTTSYPLYYFGASVTWDGPGYPAGKSNTANMWVFVSTRDTNNIFHSEVWKVSPAGIATKSLDLPWSSGYLSADLIPMGGNRLALVGSEDGVGGPYFFDFFSGNSWLGVQKTGARGLFWQGSCAPYVQGNATQVMCVIPEGGSLDVYRIDYGAKAWPSVSTSLGRGDRASVTGDGGLNLVGSAFDYSSDTIYYLRSMDGGFTWGPTVIISAHELGYPLVDYPGLDASASFSPNGVFTLGWTTGMNPYQVRVFEA